MCGRVWPDTIWPLPIADRLTMGRDPPHRRSSPQSPNSHSEQPLAEEDVVKMRARIADMGLSSDAEVQNLTSKEKELGGMVRFFW